MFKLEIHNFLKNGISRIYVQIFSQYQSDHWYEYLPGFRNFPLTSIFVANIFAIDIGKASSRRRASWNIHFRKFSDDLQTVTTLYPTISGSRSLYQANQFRSSSVWAWPPLVLLKTFLSGVHTSLRMFLWIYLMYTALNMYKFKSQPQKLLKQENIQVPTKGYFCWM